MESFEFRPIPKTAHGRAGSKKREVPKEPKQVVPREHPNAFLEYKDEPRPMSKAARGRELANERRAGPSHVGSMDPEIPAKPPKMEENIEMAAAPKPPKGARDRSRSKRRDNSEARRQRKVGFAMDMDKTREEAQMPKPEVKPMSAAERWIFEAREENRLEIAKKTSGGECHFIGFGDDVEPIMKPPRRIR